MVSDAGADDAGVGWRATGIVPVVAA